MRAPRRGPLLEAFWKVHKLAHRVTGGRFFNRVVGMPVLALTTTGRRSGEPRTVLLNYLDHPDGFVVVASNAGADSAPLWWRNLESHPEATARIKNGPPIPVVAEELTGDDRETWWAALVAANPGYGDYATYTERHIPVVLLRRIG